MKKYAKLLAILCLILSGCSLKKNAYESIKKDEIINWARKQPKITYGDEKLTVDKAVNISYAYNKQLLVAKEQKEFAKGQILESISNFLPSIQALGAYTYLEDHSKIKVNGQNLTLGSKDNLSFTLQATQPIFTGGATISGYKASAFSSFITNENINSQYQKLYFEVAKVYFDILLSEKLFKVQEMSLNNAKTHFDEVKTKHENGLASKYDLLRSEVEVTNFEASVIKQKNQVSLFKTVFLKLLGLNQEFNFELENMLNFDSYEIEIDEALKTAYLSRPDFKAKSFEIDLQKQMVNIVKSDYFPKIHSTFAHRWGTEGSNIVTPDRWARDWNIRIGLSWDLLDFGRTRGKLKQQTSLLRQKKYLLQDVSETISLEVKQAILNFNDAQEFVKSQKLDLKRAKKAFDLANLGYKEGLKTQIEVSDALTALTRSQSLYYQSIYQYNLSIIQLKLVMGILKEN